MQYNAPSYYQDPYTLLHGEEPLLIIKQIRKEAGASLNDTLSEYTQWMIYIENPLLRKA